MKGKGKNLVWWNGDKWLRPDGWKNWLLLLLRPRSNLSLSSGAAGGAPPALTLRSLSLKIAHSHTLTYMYSKKKQSVHQLQRWNDLIHQTHSEGRRNWLEIAGHVTDFVILCVWLMLLNWWNIKWCTTMLLPSLGREDCGEVSET